MRKTFQSTGHDVESRSNNLVLAGPVLELVVRSPTQPKQPRNVKALIDTGASLSCIQRSLADKMNLKITDRRRISGVSALDVDSQGLCDIGFAWLELDQPHVQIPTEVLVARFETGDPDIRLLIGRPFLKFFDLFYEGSMGRFSLEKTNDFATGPDHI